MNLARAACFALIIVAATLAMLPAQPPPAVPVSGKAGPGLEPIDRAVLAMMDRHGIPGAALAIARKGKLVLAKGYGWANIETNEGVQPDTVFGLASLSKPWTAIAVLKLVEQGKLKLDDRAFDHLPRLAPALGVRVDPRLGGITIRQLLNHSGGWDRKKSGDPATWGRRIAQALGMRPPLSPDTFIRYMMTHRLDFDPGTQEQYSNVGYIILGQVIEAASGKPYEAFVREQVLAPAGARGALHLSNPRYRPGEAHCYLAGTVNELPPLNDPMIAAAGGWYASAIDLVRVLTALDGTRGKPLLGADAIREMLALPPRPLGRQPNGTWVGLGWDSVITPEAGPGYFKDGSWHGMRTFMKRTPQGNDWALLFNASMNPDTRDTQMIAEALREIREAVESASLPDADLFGEFR